jgi:hypothetical protein
MASSSDRRWSIAVLAAGAPGAHHLKEKVLAAGNTDVVAIAMIFEGAGPPDQESPAVVD